MKKEVLLLIIVVVLTICVIFVTAYRKIGYNNADRIETLITETYSHEEIQSLISEFVNSTLEYSDLQVKFNIQCVRKTYQGYYAVLLQDDGSKVFVFMNNQLQLNKILLFNQFMSQEYFEVQCSKRQNITIDEVSEIDPNTIPMSTSMVLQTAHIVKEGLIIATFTSFVNGVVLDEAILESLQFLSNEAMAQEENHLGIKHIPYILEIDKN